MIDLPTPTRSKIRPGHLDRAAYVYVRQSSPQQVREHQESRRRQYELADWALAAGWPRDRIVVIDEDQGKSSATPKTRPGFERLATAAGCGEVGIVIALEVTRLARNSPDWHHLIYMCRWTDTLIADDQTVYDPTNPADRLVLGIRGQMGELELENSIQRMVAATWSKARRGELLRTPPAGIDIDDLGRYVITPDEAVAHAIRTVFDKFDELGSARQVFAWWKTSNLKFPIRRIAGRRHPVIWVAPRYKMFLRTLHNPIYAGVYVFGRSQTVRKLDPDDPQKLSVRRIARQDWPVLIRDHHPGYISFEKFRETQQRIRGNAMMPTKRRGDEQGPVREGPALLQGLVRCGCCGRPMVLSYGGHRSVRAKRIYQYRCKAARMQGVGPDCQTIGGRRIDEAVVAVFLEATQPAALEAARLANEQVQREREAVGHYWDYQVEKAAYEAQRAERQFQAVEPENRVVARELERRWNARLVELETLRAQAQEALRGQPLLSDEELKKIAQLSTDLEALWHAPTTTNRDRKRLLRCLIEEVQLRTAEQHYAVKIVWKGGAITEREVPRIRAGKVQATGEESVELVRKLALEFDDAQIARILNKQGRRTGFGNPFTKANVCSLRGRRRIPACPPRRVRDPREGPFTADEAARELGVTMSTIHRWLRVGLLAGTQATAGAPWRIVLTEEVRHRLCCGEAPRGWVGLSEAARRLGLSKSRVAYLVNTGKLPAVNTTVRGRRCWRIDVSSTDYGDQRNLIDQKHNDHTKES
jgi:DNA invertase Pin-like site-specific DNA recombinase